MTTTKYLVTGHTGMLGREVVKRLSPAEVHCVDRTRFDLMDPSGVYEYVMQQQPAAVLHLAADTDVDLCEREPARAGIKNHLATLEIARAARDCGAYLLYVSTSNVFGAEGKLRYLELDSPSSCNYYGRSKLMGEAAVQAFHGPSSMIVRAGWMVGGGREHDRKFVGKIVQQIADKAQRLRAVSDKFGSITSSALLSEFIVWAAKRRETGLIHYASEGMVSRFAIAEFVAKSFEFEGTVTPVQSSEFPLSAARPASEYIESIYLPRLGGAPRPGTWQEDLGRYLEEFK